MKALGKMILRHFGKPVDLLFGLLAIPAALLLLTYRRSGSSRLPLTTSLLKRIGVFPIRNHYYEPLFDDRLLTRNLHDTRHLPGIDLNVAGQLHMLEKLVYSRELTALELSKSGDDPDSFHFNNGSFESGDAEFLYQLVRFVKPRKIIEIGSGNSTKIARLALRKNWSENQKNYKHICVEPYEQPWLEGLKDVSVIRERVESLSFNWQSELESGDILFIDSSHVIRPQGDVLKEYLEIIPLLQSGVLVHVHDIFTPRDYLHSWVVDKVLFWNEQYLLEALLSNSKRYEVVAAVNYLKNNHFDALQGVCPYLTADREPGSFYFRVVHSG